MCTVVLWYINFMKNYKLTFTESYDDLEFWVLLTLIQKSQNFELNCRSNRKFGPAVIMHMKVSEVLLRISL